MTTDETLNELLVRLFKDIMEIEGNVIVTEEFKDLSYNDFHVIEQSESMNQNDDNGGKTDGCHNRNVDKGNGWTDRKGYVIRERSTQDKRVVWVYLTDTGKAAYKHHEEFHEKMSQAAISEMSEDEVKVLLKSLNNLSKFFHSYDNE